MRRAVPTRKIGGVDRLGGECGILDAVGEQRVHLADAATQRLHRVVNSSCGAAGRGVLRVESGGEPLEMVDRVGPDIALVADAGNSAASTVACSAARVTVPASAAIDLNPLG